MNRRTVKYFAGVAAFMAAASFCGCGDSGAEVIPIESISEEVSVPAPSAEENEKKTVKVYVCGAVRAPDVYSLDEDMRVADAVDAAGGFTADAGTDYLNLAAPVTDGQKIYIPTDTEIEEALAEGRIIPDNPMTEQADGAGKVDINSADKATLMTLPGIGESKADKIIAYREQNGGFASIEDIMLVGGIKEGLFNKVKDSICVR